MTIDMSTVPGAVEQALVHLNKKYGHVLTWQQEQQRWQREWGLALHRRPHGDYILFPSEEQLILWLLKWT
jgi:hypothetical protein